MAARGAPFLGSSLSLSLSLSHTLSLSHARARAHTYIHTHTHTHTKTRRREQGPPCRDRLGPLRADDRGKSAAAGVIAGALSSPWNAGVIALASGADPDGCTGPYGLCAGSPPYQVRRAAGSVRRLRRVTDRVTAGDACRRCSLLSVTWVAAERALGQAEGGGSRVPVVSGGGEVPLTLVCVETGLRTRRSEFPGAELAAPPPRAWAGLRSDYRRRVADYQ